MCGIVGYVGTQDATPLLMEGLKRLEYRGYDSAGIALFQNGQVQVRKTKGALASLEGLLQQNPVSGTTGIGHTRWATHGVPSTLNSHPHTSADQVITVVHNGIIENDQELKQILADDGIRPVSDTDTEILAHFIAKHVAATGDMLAGIREALKGVRGAFALGILHRDQPDTLYAARHKSPLIVGLSEHGNFIASDVPAILNRAKQAVYLDDGEVAVLTRAGVEVSDLEGATVRHTPQTIELENQDVDKGGFETYMLKEIHEQTRVLHELIDQHTGGPVDLKLDDGQLRSIQRILIVSCGTAYYAAMYGRYLIEHYTDIPVEVDLGSEFRYRSPKIDEHTLVMAVSQSGETADTLASIELAKEIGCPILSICNVEGSSLTRVSDQVIYTEAGPEIGVASTKAFTAQLTAFVLFMLHLTRVRGDLPDEQREAIRNALRGIPNSIHYLLQDKASIRDIAEKHHEGPSALYLGRRFNYPIALEGALKNKEISYQHAEGYAAGEMKHGPIALINEYLPVICICTDTDDDIAEKMIANVREVKSRAGRIIALVSEGDERMNEIADDLIPVPRTMEALSPLINVVALQLLAYYAAQARGTNIDRPRNLAKSVTVE